MRFVRFLLFLLITCVVYSSHAKTNYVSPDGTQTSPPFTSWALAASNIQAALDAAVEGDVVLATNGTYKTPGRSIAGATTIAIVTNGITLRSVNGAGLTFIDGSSSNRCLYLNYSDAVVEGFTLTRGNAGWNGDGILLDGNGTVKDCNVISNAGGGVNFNDGGLLLNCIVAGHPGSGVWCNDSGTMRGCVFYSNGWYAVYCNHGGTVENCTMAMNGGGASCYFGGTVRNCIMYYNDDQGNWYISGTNRIFYNIAFSNNCTFPHVPGSYGTVTSEPEFVDPAQCDFTLRPGSPCVNTGVNQGWTAGAKDIYGADRVMYGTSDIGASEFVSNGLICNITTDIREGFPPLAVPFVSSVSGTNPSALYYSWDFNNDGSIETGGVALVAVTNTYAGYGYYSPALTVSNIINAGAAHVTRTDYVKLGPPTAYAALNSPVPIYPYTNWTTAATSIHDAVTAAVGGSTVWVSNGAYLLSSSIAVNRGVNVRSVNGYSNTLLDGNQSNVCVWLSHTNAALDGFTLTRGASSRGGGIRCTYGGTVRNCLIVSNQTTGSGGGVFCQFGGVVSNCIIRDNLANVGGGVGCMHGGTVLDCHIAGNSATQQAGGINFYHEWGEARNCAIVSNQAETGGGCDLNRGGFISSSVISANHARELGGGLDFSNGGLAEDCAINGNRADSEGGGMYFNNGGSATNCVISGNCVSSNDGGGAYCVQGGTLIGCAFSNNTARAGGGVSCDQGGALINCVIERNLATNGAGGGVSVYFAGTADRCVIRANSSTNGHGGGIYLHKGGEARNCLVTLNSALGFQQCGGGIGCYQGGLAENCTVVSNTADWDGGGIFLNGGGTSRNCIARFNTTVLTGRDCFYQDSGWDWSYSCIWPLIAGDGNTTNDPFFVDFAGGDFHLATNSVCIDAGANQAWMAAAKDLDGKDRILNGTVDMGCHELIPHSWDMNANGIADFWEWDNFAGTNVNETADPDTDGMNNFGEYYAGTDPNSSASRLAFSGLQAPPPSGTTNIVLSWSSVPGKFYTLQRGTNLQAAPSLTNRQSNIVGLITTTVYTDAVDVAGPYYYRVKVQ